MIYSFKGPFQYTRSILEGWNNNQIGVYYIGVESSSGSLRPYYIGKGTGQGGMRRRLMDHLGEWRDVTHFGYQVTDTIREAENHEVDKITQHKPKYNDHHNN